MRLGLDQIIGAPENAGETSMPNDMDIELSDNELLEAAFAQAEYCISILRNVVADGGPDAATAQADLEMLATALAA